MLAGCEFEVDMVSMTNAAQKECKKGEDVDGQ